MAGHLGPRYYYGDDNSSHRTTIIIVIAVVAAIKICVIVIACHAKNRKQAERRAKGCHCDDDIDYCCT